jgi:hypothetical protein
MGGFNAPIAAIVAALFALALGPAGAAAEGPVDVASAAPPVQQRAAEIAEPALQQATSAVPSSRLPSAPAPSTVREAVVPLVSGTAHGERKQPDTGSRVAPAGEAPRSSAAPAPRVTRVIAGAETNDRAKGRPEGGSGRGRSVLRARGDRSTSSTAPERNRAQVAAPSGQRTFAATPIQEPTPGDAGTAAGPRAFAAPGSFLLIASLVVLLAASRPFCLRPLRIPATTLRRLVFVSPGVPPG